LVVRKYFSSDPLARIVDLTQEGERVAAEYFEKHARDLKDLLSVLSEKEKQPSATKMLITLDKASPKNESDK
jgi:DNA-binding MarR family transcriptional regulator